MWHILCMQYKHTNSVVQEGSAKHRWLQLYKAVSMCFATGGVMLRFSAGRASLTRPGLMARPCRLQEMRGLLCTVNGYSTNPSPTLLPYCLACHNACCTWLGCMDVLMFDTKLCVCTSPWDSLNSLNGMLPYVVGPHSAVFEDISLGCVTGIRRVASSQWEKQAARLLLAAT